MANLPKTPTKDKPQMELVNFVFELQVLQVTNLPKSISNSEKVEILWRRGQGFKSTKTGYVVDGKALISDTITLRAKLNYDPIAQVFESKNTQVQLRHVNTDEVIAETDLDLAEHINLEVSTTIELEDLVPRLQEASDSEEETEPQNKAPSTVQVMVQFKSKEDRKASQANSRQRMQSAAVPTSNKRYSMIRMHNKLQQKVAIGAHLAHQTTVLPSKNSTDGQKNAPLPHMSLVSNMSTIERDANALAQKEKVKKYTKKCEGRVADIKQQVDEAFGKIIKLQKRDIPELLERIDSMYNHLQPETKIAFQNLDTIISEKKTTSEYLDYQIDEMQQRLQDLKGKPLISNLVDVMAELDLAQEKNAESQLAVKKFYDFEAEDDTGPELYSKRLPGGSTGETNAVHSMSEHFRRDSSSHMRQQKVSKNQEPFSDN